MILLVGLHLEMEKEEREFLEERHKVSEKKKQRRKQEDLSGNVGTRQSSDESLVYSSEDLIRIMYRINRHTLPVETPTADFIIETVKYIPHIHHLLKKRS